MSNYCSQVFISRSSLADMLLYLDRCKIALLVESKRTGGFTTDSGTLADLASRGKVLLDSCLTTRPGPGGYALSGGVRYAGTHGKLNIVVFDKGLCFRSCYN